MSEPFRFSLSARGFTIKLAVAAAVLVWLHVVMWIVYDKTSVLNGQDHWILMLDLDTEASFGTWFSSLVLLLTGVFTLVHAASQRGSKGGPDRWWWFIGIALVLASLDEVAGLHEALNSDSHYTSLVGHWTVAGAVLSAALGIAILPFLWRLPLRTRFLLITAGIVFLSGAVGVEFATIGYERADDLNSLAYNLWNALEEGLEMAGILLYLYALLDCMARNRDGKVNLRVNPRP